MTARQILEHTADVVDARRKAYGPPDDIMTAIAARWSLTLGHRVTPAQVTLCMIDLKLARLVHDPEYRDGVVDVIGYAALLALYLATIPAANWMIGNVGTTCVPGAPCLVPVGFGMTAPSGVLLIGIALVLRDLVHRDLGARWAAAGVAAGSGLSFAIAPAELAFASLVAFAVSEALDQAVYTPLRRRRLVLAVLASGVVGAVADSTLFLWLAFGSLDHMTGQVVGKLWMVGAAAAFLGLRSRRRPAAAAP